MRDEPSPIAVIGVSARVPGAEDLESFWEMLQTGRDAISEVSPERWEAGAFYDADPGAAGKTYCVKGGFLTGIDEFDAPFFGLEADEARKMDPQQRLALQEAWRTFEDAGYLPDRFRGKNIGVFVGARTGDYHDAILDESEELDPPTLMGHDSSILSARLSHFLDLRGPNLTVNTACSSMGVALHLATQSLRSGEVDMALVGGVNIMCTPQRFLMHSRSGLLSKTGECRPLDEGADGFVLGEAVGFVLLKRREDAIADADWICGNIIATGVNHGGYREKGISAPSPEAQAALIRSVLEKSAFPPQTIGYVETHGTGTYKGDALEVNALREAYGSGSCVIGSVKANVGHALTAAVLPGLLKILASFRNRKLPRQAHFETANALLPIGENPFRILTETAEWTTDGAPRRAALSAFSYTGANFHMILEEETQRSIEKPSRPRQAFARHRYGLREPEADVTFFFSRRDDVFQAFQAARQNSPILVKCSDGFRRLGPAIYQIDPTREEDCRRLVEALGPLERKRIQIVHLWNYDCEPLDFASHGNVDRCLHLLGRCLDVGERALSLFRRSLPRLASVSALYVCHGVQPQDGMAAGLFEEDPEVRWKVLRLPDRAGSAEELAAKILRELEKKSRLVGPAESLFGKLELKKNGVYLLDVGRDSRGKRFAEEWERSGVGRPIVLGEGGLGLHDLESLGLSEIDGVVRFLEPSDRESFPRNVAESLRLDDFTKDFALDFFLLLRPEASGAGRFSEGFVKLREQMTARGLRRGKSVVTSRSEFHEIFEARPAREIASTEPIRFGHEARFLRIVSETLRLERTLDLSSPLEDLDLNSMRIVEIVDRLHHTFQAALRPSLFYRHKTLGGVFGELNLSPAATPLAVEPGRSISASASFSSDPAIPEPVAIIGMSGRFPKARDLGEFWANLRDGRDGITEMPENRWSEKTSPPRGGFIDDIDKFDPQFFGISTREAELMDPQHRLFLQGVWQAVEDAGYDPAALAGTATGVFVGVATCDYAGILEAAGQGRQAHGPIGSFHSMLANRVSYLLDLRGPSQPIDTACSSSLVAVHRALQAIRSGECTQAIVGGVNALLTPPLFEAFRQAGMLSPDGRCQTFDANANGYVRGEGVGVLLLKPLHQALADKDPIHALIRASAENHGGHASSLTAPTPQAQADVLARCYREADIAPETVGYIEAHGTGTSLGDPIEVDGLKQAFETASEQASTGRAGWCGLGSVKTNIGHLEAAAGIAGLIKVVLAIRHRTLPGNLHFERLNPYVALENSPFFIVDRTQAWKRFENGRGEELPLRAGVSSFGFGGVNAHVVIEELLREEPRAAAFTGRNYPIVLSAKTDERLRESAAQLFRLVSAEGDKLALPDLAYTLQVGRAAMEARLAMTVDSQETLEAGLKAFLAGDSFPGLHTGSAGRKDRALALFAEEALQEVVGKWMRQGEWPRLLELWVQGLKVDWKKFSSGESPSRIHLPTYPFARERIWVTPKSIETKPRPTCWLRKQWESAAIQPWARANATVLIAANRGTLPLAARLLPYFSGGEILDVESSVEPAWESYDGLIDLVGCGEMAGESLAWIEGVQKFVERAGENEPFLLAVTRGLESFENSSINLSGALRAGLYRLLQSEYPAVRSRHLDAEPQVDEGTLAEQIVAEFFSGGDEAEVCYRRGERFRAGLRETPAPAASDPATGFPREHVLWITGGTRGLGALCATHLVRRYGVKKLVLTGRETLPAREAWTREQKKTVGAKIRAIQDLEAQGVEVRVLSVDLSDAEAVRRCRDEVRHEMGPIGGLLHCAGAVDEENPAFIRKPLAAIRDILAPKVTGTDVLLECFRDEPLAFMVFFSSVSAIVPRLGAGVGDYAMANAYLDYAAAAAKLAFPVTSVQWPSWKETGMGEVKTEAYVQAGFLSLTNAEGLQFLDRVLAARSGSTWLPAVCDPGIWKPEMLLRHQPRKPSAPPSVPEATRAWLAELFARELKMDLEKIKADVPFAEYGMDSILLTQVWRQLERKLGTRLDPSAAFEYPTLEKLADWLARTQGATVLAAAPPASIPAAAAKGRHADLAVVGLSCRFPGADNAEEFWRLLSEGRSAITRVPEDRWKNPEGFMAGLVGNLTDFDPEYFFLSEADARAMDPQALLVLEESVNLFHDAGYTPEEIKGAEIGVYLGARTRHRPEPSRLLEARNPILALGQNYLAANVSRFFDLRGPSLVVDTACSSALVGMHLALQALKSGEIEAAVVGGVSLLTDDTAHRLFRQRNLLSPGASFHLFDQRAAGVVPGEGIGLVLLKTVARAEADGDRILAVIKGLAINNDGRTAGPATPNLQAQKAVMQAALERSGVRPGEVETIEANGSGSEITDLLELKAMEAVYGSDPRPKPCFLGSVKPNIGHALCAEGIAGFIKLVLMLDRGRQIPFLSGEKAMAHYDFARSPFSFPRESAPWSGRLRRAALSCFADGGTNAHVILESRETDAGPAARRAPIPPPSFQRRNLWKSTENPWPETIDSEHPFLRNHLAHGQRLLPGLAYFDLLYQFLRVEGFLPWEIELSNLTIHHPLSASPGTPVRIEILGEGARGVWHWRVQGRELHVTAEMRKVAPVVFEEAVDLEAIRAVSEAAPLSEAYDHFRRKGLVHTGSMKAEGTIRATDEGRVIELSLPPGSTDDFLFHPALMDAAAVGAGTMFADLLDGEERLFLPLFFGRFRASAPIREGCFARVRKASLRRKNELLYSDMEFFDRDGAKVAELTDFAYKLVRQADSISSEAPAGMLTAADSWAGGAAGLLQGVIASKLKRPAEKVNLDAGYYELGLESAMLLDLVAVVGKRLGVSLSPTLLFEYATPAELASHLERSFPEELANLETRDAPEKESEARFEVVEFPADGFESESAGAEVETLLAGLASSRLALWVEAGTLHVRAEEGRLTPALREKIRRHRNEIAGFLGPRKLLPLTRSQKRYWVLSSLQPDRSAYNNPIGMRLRGDVEIERLKEAFLILMNSHEVLRSHCPRLGKGPVMLVEPPVAEAPCEVIPLTETNPENREKILLDLAVEESRKPINPSLGPNLRIRILQAAERDVTVLLTAHHTVFDGYSYLPVMSELMRIYRALEKNENPREERRQYESYTLREKPTGGDESARFWKQHLAGAPGSIDLPLDRKRAPVNAGHGDIRSILIESETSRSMNEAIQEHRVTPFAFMLSILKIAFAAWTRQTDLVIGTTVQCRDDEADRWVIGDFTNFIPIRSRLEAGETFWQFVGKVYQSSLLCLQHKNFPFEEIVPMAAPAPRNFNPVYNILVNQLPSITEMEERLSDKKLQVSVSNNRLLNKSAMLDLRFEWYEDRGGLKLICEYNTGLFDGETIEALLRRIALCLSTRAYAGDPEALGLIPFEPAPIERAAASLPIPAVTRKSRSPGDAEALLIRKILELKSIPEIAKMKAVSFFELGLDSFDIANLSADLELVYPEFVVGEIFKHPTIRALAAFLDESSRKEATAAEGSIDFDLFRT